MTRSMVHAAFAEAAPHVSWKVIDEVRLIDWVVCEREGERETERVCSLLQQSEFSITRTFAQSSINAFPYPQIFDEIDLDHDGRVSCQDFVTMYGSKAHRLRH